MKLVDRKDIESWAKTFDAKGNFPALISRLIRATSAYDTYIDVPSGSTAFVGGWDAVVINNKPSPYVPEGISLWEFGTEADNKGKADDDYEKRTKNPEGYDSAKSTFIFATPRFWRDKGKWIKAKMDEGIWLDVRVYDSSIIEQWLEIASAVSRWFSSYISKYPTDGIITIDEFWKEWSLGPKCELFPNIITSGREKEAEQLLSFLSSDASIKAIKAASKEEATAFIIACAKQFEIQHSEKFFSKSLIIDTSANFRSIRINAHALNLIARFEEPSALYSAAADGHHVLVPLGPDDNLNQDTISLPPVEPVGQIYSLQQSGFSEDEARRYSKESARDITILKRLLKFPQSKLEWVKGDNVLEIVPAMLLGRWNQNRVGDRKLLEKLSGESYENYIVKIEKWRDAPESPFLQIGETWRLASPLDAWANLSAFVTKANTDMLRECFLETFKDGNQPVVKEEDSQFPSEFFSKEKTYSTWAREGLIQSLTLIGLYGEGIKIPNISAPQDWVDEIVADLLNQASVDLWISLDHEMPLLAEASPLSFIDAINNSFDGNKSIENIFEETEGFISPSSHHTGMLWALEGLVWMPDYFQDATLTLAKLAAVDPGGRLSNRPINSLSEIFKPWHYQTLASLEDRKLALIQISKSTNDIGWQLLLRMLPKDNGIAHPTHKLRWRMFTLNSDINYTYEEIWATHTFVVEQLLSRFIIDESKFATIIEESVALAPKDRAKVLDFAESYVLSIDQKNFSTWHSIRNILARHRSHPDTNWALPETDLVRYEALYNLLEPKDVIKQNIWLFNEHWPSFPEGFVHKKNDWESRHQQQQAILDSARKSALDSLIEEFGLTETINLANEIKEPAIMGDQMAKIVIDSEQIGLILKGLEEKGSLLQFTRSFVFRKFHLNGLAWIIRVFDRLKSKGFSEAALVQLLISVNPSTVLWDFIENSSEEICKNYWQLVNPNFYALSTDEKIRGINKLMAAGRTPTAIHEIAHDLNEMPTDLIVKALETAASSKLEEPIITRDYEISNLFRVLDERKDINHDTLIKLEWIYLGFLSSYPGNSPKNLNDELSKNPSFFIDVLKFVYMPKDKQRLEEEAKTYSSDIRQNMSLQGYKLLKAWTRMPGVDDEGGIDKDFMNDWVDQVRKMAKEVDRLEVADGQIGQIMAQYPEKGQKTWPPDQIAEIIERINTDDVKSSFSTALFNKRGSSSRGPFDGGAIERRHAEYFQRLSNEHKLRHPNISRIFKNLAKGYFLDAKQMDEIAERDKLEY